MAEKNNRGLDVSDRLYKPKRPSGYLHHTQDQLHMLPNNYDMHENLHGLKSKDQTFDKAVKASSFK